MTLGSNQTIALKALEEPLTNSADIGKDGAPQGKSCLLYEHALDIVAQKMPGGVRHKKERAKSALLGLVNINIVCMNGDWLWVN